MNALEELKNTLEFGEKFLQKETGGNYKKKHLQHRKTLRYQ